MDRDHVYLLLLSGRQEDADNFVATHYPECECIQLSPRELREGGWRGQIKAFRRLRGKAFIFFRESLSYVQEPQLALWSALLHRCRFTVLADSAGRTQVSTRWTLIRALPQSMVSGFCDLLTFALSWCLMRLLRTKPHSLRVHGVPAPDLSLIYLYPYPLDLTLAGGALSHVKGFLGGLVANCARCEIFSGKPLPVKEFPVHLVPAKRRLFLFRESKLLSYNFRFALTVCRRLRGCQAGALYQRHGRFVFAGVLLSVFSRLPFILEYNGSEDWFADHWDPARFRTWLRLGEEVSLARAHLIVVVSEALRQELLQRGVSEERILLNPNGVDPVKFQPGHGGEQVRQQLGISHADIVVSFVGTFHYFHGTKVLEQAILLILQSATAEANVQRLRFLLVGEGLLQREMREQLQPYVGKQVLFAGLVPHAQIASYLDAADILVSPHVPMPDGRPFIGSPTKLFEYMAMAKGIIASNLDQLSSVLNHGSNAWLIEPGNVSELASAIVLLAQDPDLRNRMGQNARASALAKHTWQQNAERVLARVRIGTACEVTAGALGRTA
jgi:glycosyltransferase involved in cell wall biosynthesis